MESSTDMLSRLNLIAENEYGDWDLSDNDTDALRWGVAQIEAAQKKEVETESSTIDNKSSPKLPNIEECLISIGMPNSEGRNLTPAYSAAINMYDLIVRKIGR